MYVLGPGKEATPAVQVLVAITAQVPPNVLNLPLSLVIGLWMVSKCETYGGTDYVRQIWTPRRQKKALQTLEMNCAPRSETTKLRKT